MGALASRLPWWTKIAAKMALTHIPLAYSVWRKLGLFRAGAMDDVSYAKGNFDARLKRAEEVLAAENLAFPDGFRVLECGPGDSVLTSVFAPAYGAGETLMVDVAPLASADPALYRKATATLAQEGRPVPDLSQCTDLSAILKAVNGRYLTNGTASLAEVADRSVDLCISTAVLEHIRLGEFDRFMAELRRVSAPGAVHVHAVDLRDHLATNLHNLRFSEKRWESPLMAEAGFYTNRIRYSDMLERFRRAGFAVRVDSTTAWPDVPLARSKMAPDFAKLPDEELKIASFSCVLRPA